jgi:HlyD family secretion protein
MTDKTVFRKVSLERLASPEKLDLLLSVTDLRGWIALCATWLILLAAGVWAVLGRIPQTVTGTGILTRSGGVLEVIAMAGGPVTDVSVAVGDTITEGQVVARVAQPELSARLVQAKAALSNLQNGLRHLIAFGMQESAVQSEQLALQRAALKQSINSARRTAHWTADRIAIQTKLVNEGLILKQTVLDSGQQKHAALERIADGQSQLAQLDVKALELRNRYAESVAASQFRVKDAERTVDDLTNELQSKAQIVTPYTGRVLEVLMEQGMVTAAGAPIVRLDLSGRAVKDLEAVLYVPSDSGKQIRVGMPVLIAPSTVKEEEYGMMLGNVTFVSEFPATVQGMQRVLRNEKLIAALAGSDAPYEIHADLAVDPTTRSRYRWSSSQGPAQRILSGTTATASIEVSSRRPIQLVLPLVRHFSGL